MSLKFLSLIFLLFVVGPDCSAGADDYYYYYYYYGDGGGGGGGSGGSSEPKAQDPEEIEYAVVFGITAPLILVVVYMAIVGVRNGDPRRWHSINVLIWMLWQTVLYADVAQKSPWRGFIKNDDVQIMNIYMQIHNISVITGGNILLLIETITSSIMYICKPKARRSYTYSIVWFIIMIPVYNAIQVTLFVCKYALPNQKWWYDPVEAFHVITCLLHGLLLVLFLLFAIVMTVLIPICGGKRKDPSSESALFPILRLWLTWIYCLITAILIIPFQSMNVASFVLTKFSAQIADFMSSFDMSGAGGFDGMADLMQMAATYLGLNDFLVLCVPLTVAILTLVCFPCFWTPLINMLTCGRLLPIKSKKSTEMKAWATNSSIFPSGEPSMEKKVPPP